MKKSIILGLLVVTACGTSTNPDAGIGNNGSSSTEVTASAGPTSPPPVDATQPNDGVQVLQPLLNDQFRQYITSRSAPGSTDFAFHLMKSDGQPISVNGAVGYRMFLKGTAVLPNGFKPECLRMLCIISSGGPPYSATPVTMIYDISADFTKTENGWREVALNYDFSRPTSVSQAAAAPPPPVVAPSCVPTVGTAAQVAAASRGKPVAPETNKLVLLKSNSFTWNGRSVDRASVFGYVEVLKQISPRPYLILVSEPGNHQITGIRMLLKGEGFCFIGE